MTFDINAFLAKLIETMPIWLPVVIAALHAPQPPYMTKSEKSDQ